MIPCPSSEKITVPFSRNKIEAGYKFMHIYKCIAIDLNNIEYISPHDA